MTLEELIRERESLQPLTKGLYLRAIRDFIDCAGADPRGWTPEAVLNWRRRLRATKLKPQSINTRINALRTASRLWSEFHRDQRLDFAMSVETLRVVEPGVKKQAVTYQQADELLNACRGDAPPDLRDYAMCVLGFKTGMRRMSLALLELELIDWRRRVMTITVKGGRLHKMPPLDESTFEALEPWREWLRRRGIRSGRMFRGFVANAKLGSLGLRESLSVDGVYQALRARAKLAELDGFTPHVFRHTFVTWMQALRMPGYLIQAYTGHKSDAMVIEYTDAWLAAEKQPPMALFQVGQVRR